MKRFFIALLLAAIASSAMAETAPPDQTPRAGGSSAGAINPAVSAAQEIDRLFGELQSSTLADPKRVEGKILASWLSNPSPTAELLLKQASLALSDGALDTSEKILNQLIGAYPDYIEALNRRAALYLRLKRFDEAMADIDQVLENEPRHFGALAGKGAIFAARGNFAAAEEAFQEALVVNPHMEIVRAALKKLQLEIPGI